MSILKKIDLFGREVNLRFMGEDRFRTNCGGVATILMCLTLVIIFVLGILDVYEGKIDSFNYMVINAHQSKDLQAFGRSSSLLPFSTRQSLSRRVIGYAVDSKTLDDSFLTVEAFYSKGKDFFSRGENSLYNCTREVYGGLSSSLKNVVPPGLTIYCLNTTTEKLKENLNPRIVLKPCEENSNKKDYNSENNNNNDSHRGILAHKRPRLHDTIKNRENSKKCKNRTELAEGLKKFDVWAFSLVDASDFSIVQTKLEMGYTAIRIPASIDYKKSSRMILRSVDLTIQRGIFVPQTHHLSTDMFLRDKHEVELSRNNPRKELLDLELEIDKNSKVVIEKRYITIFSIFAYMGGLSKGIGLFLLIIVFPVREIKYYQNLINNMFNVCLNENQRDLALKTLFRDYEEKIKQIEMEDKKEREELRSLKKEDRIKRKELRRKRTRTTKFTYLKRMMAEKEMKDRKGGLFGDFLEGRIDSEEFFKNMIETSNELQKEGKKGGISDLVVGALNIKKRRKKTYIKQPPGVLPDGSIRDVNEYERRLLSGETVGIGLKRWILRVRQRYFERQRADFVKRLQEGGGGGRARRGSLKETDKGNDAQKLVVGKKKAFTRARTNMNHLGGHISEEEDGNSSVGSGDGQRGPRRGKGRFGLKKNFFMAKSGGPKLPTFTNISEQFSSKNLHNMSFAARTPDFSEKRAKLNILSPDKLSSLGEVIGAKNRTNEPRGIADVEYESETSIGAHKIGRILSRSMQGRGALTVLQKKLIEGKSLNSSIPPINEAPKTKGMMDETNFLKNREKKKELVSSLLLESKEQEKGALPSQAGQGGSGDSEIGSRSVGGPEQNSGPRQQTQRPQQPFRPPPAQSLPRIMINSTGGAQHEVITSNRHRVRRSTDELPRRDQGNALSTSMPFGVDQVGQNDQKGVSETMLRKDPKIDPEANPEQNQALFQSLPPENNDLEEENVFKPPKRSLTSKFTDMDWMGLGLAKSAFRKSATMMPNIMPGLMKGLGFLKSLATFRKNAGNAKRKLMRKKSVIENHSKKLEELKKQNQLLYNHQAELRFQTSVLDYLRLLVPAWVDGGYSKRTLFLQVTFLLIFANLSQFCQICLILSKLFLLYFGQYVGIFRL